MKKVFVKYTAPPGRGDRVTIGDVIFSSDPKVEPTSLGYLMDEKWVKTWRAALLEYGFIIFDEDFFLSAISEYARRQFSVNKIELANAIRDAVSVSEDAADLLTEGLGLQLQPGEKAVEVVKAKLADMEAQIMKLTEDGRLQAEELAVLQPLKPALDDARGEALLYHQEIEKLSADLQASAEKLAAKEKELEAQIWAATESSKKVAELEAEVKRLTEATEKKKK